MALVEQYSLSLGFCLVFVTLVALVWNRYQQLLWLRNRAAKDGLLLIGKFRALLEHLPQHRGAANAWLSGDATFKTKLGNLAALIEQDIGDLDRLIPSSLSETLKSTWETFKRDWCNLQKHYKTSLANDSFALHSELIAKVIYFIQDYAELTQLTRYGNGHYRAMVKACVGLLPTLIETTGQARGIGSGAIAQGSITTTRAIQIRYLCDRLQATLNHVYDSLRQQHFGSVLSGNLLTECERDTRNFATVIQQQLLQNRPSMAASEYFAIGSLAFDNNLRLFDDINRVLAEDIDRAIQQRHRVKTLSNITVAIVVPVLGCFLASAAL